MQREVLENYLVGLARAVVYDFIPSSTPNLTLVVQTFHSTVNRLAAFLEISSLSTILAQSGGVQYKAGFLHLEVSKGVGLGSKSTSGKTRRSQKWCAVMDSYLVISEELGEVIPPSSSVHELNSSTSNRPRYSMSFSSTRTSRLSIQ